MVVVIFYVNLLRITEITKYWKVGSGFAMESKRQYKYVYLLYRSATLYMIMVKYQL
jgi:hypothetical protein